MYATPIMQYLKKHGQQMDTDIATGVGIPLEEARKALSLLATQGEVSRCSITRFKNGKPIDGMLYRLLGYIPPKAPGRKPSGK